MEILGKKQEEPKKEQDKKPKGLQTFISDYKKGRSEKQTNQNLELEGLSKKEIKEVWEYVNKNFKTPKDVLNS